MKIFYGVQGTGNGHIARARMMAAHFKRRNIDVQFMFTGRPPEQYFDMEVFGHYQTRHGLSFITENGKINNVKTVLQSHPIQFIRDVRSLDLSSYDVVVTDFEPVTAWAGRFQKKPVIGIGHQYAFGYPDVPQRGLNPQNRLVMRLFAPAQYRLGLHWHHFNAPIVPPIINPDEKRIPGKHDHIVVYLPFENQSYVTRILQSQSGQSFIQYSPELQDGKAGNVQLRKTSLHGFKRDLCSAGGVICNAGFELISECLHMGIPVLAKPVVGQSEQQGNAAALESLGLAKIMNALEVRDIQHWLDTMVSPPAQHYPDVAAAICDWLVSGNWQDSTGLVESLWQNAKGEHALVI